MIYPHIAKDQLGIEIDTNQFFDIEDFVKVYDANGINAPIGCGFMHRKDEFDNTCKSISNNKVTILTAPSGIGKTRLAIETCHAYDKEFKVYCVRSNGILLYEDIRFYIDNPGKYLIFLDDANMVVSLDNVLQTLLSYPENYEIKILITVRDYAKKRVITTAKKYTIPEIIEIEKFTDKEIKDILKTELGIVHPDYLTRISEIANGNARLAFLAGIRFVDKGYQAIRNAEDIFKNYYGPIIEENNLSKDDIIMLFLITVSGPVKMGENQLYSDLKKQYGAEIDEEKTVEKLYSLELVDWFKNEITSISDQSLGNYILYYVLCERKLVSIESLIAIAFPRFRNKVVYALNTIMEIFNTKDTVQYIEASINVAWDNAPKGQEMEYTESFYQVNPDKALLILKKQIKQEKHVDFDLSNFDIDAKKNYHSIATREIVIFGGFKYIESFEDSIELLVSYYEKRPDLIMDFYFVICDYLLYDKNSWKNKYKNEIVLMDKLWEATDGGNNYNFSILYIHVAQYALRTEFSYTEGIKNSKAFNFVRMPIAFTKEIALLRNTILKRLGVLRVMYEYSDTVNDILAEVHFNGIDDIDSKAYLQSDFDTLYIEVIQKDNIDFTDARIINRYREVAEQIGNPLDDRYELAEQNHDFRLYKILSREYLNGRTIEENERNRRNSIAAEMSSYTLEDYISLFETCNNLQEVLHERDLWPLSRGLDIVFELLESDNSSYVRVIEEYFKNNAPFTLNGYRQVRFLLTTIGYEKTYNLLSAADYRRKDTWLSLIWECIDENAITDAVVNDYICFSERNLNSDNPLVPSAMLLTKFGKRDSEFKQQVLKHISEKAELSITFIGRIYGDEEIKILIDLFQNDIGTLSQIYMNALEISDHVDYGGKLFAKIYEQSPYIWNKYVDWVKNHIHNDGYEQKIFELIWNTEKWQECIDYAYSVLINDDMAFFIEQPARLLFEKMEKESSIVQGRKKQWLLNYLHDNSMDVSRRSKIIEVVVTVMPYWKLDFMLEYLRIDKNIDHFKKIHLFPISESWSGSEIPLIMDKIKLLEQLKEQLKGVDYIEHRVYLEKWCTSLEEYKKKVELREYMEDVNYA